METIVKDYSTGFEGYGEIRFARRGGDELVFALWEGYFETIMNQVQPGPQGWTSLALHYHMLDAWEDDPDWEVPDVEVAAAQLDGLNRGMLKENEARILDELVTFLREGLTAGDRLFIQYF